jgi:hypothetical protein
MSTNDSNVTSAALSAPDREQEIAHIREALQGLRYGAVHIIVQDGVVNQIERTEKHRLRRPENK